MKKIFNIAIIALSTAFAVSCDLTEQSPDKYSPTIVFSTIDGVEMALGGLYAELPKVTSIYSSEPGAVDYVQKASLNNIFVKGYGPQDETTYGEWDDVRKINYFLEKLADPKYTTIDPSLVPNYVGLGRFIRAYKYFSMVSKYGDVQWYDHVVVASNKDDMFKDRDSREMVFDKILEDLDYAIENITNVSPDKSTPDKWCALFLKSRACLFEASYLKYHNANNAARIKTLYEAARDASNQIMDSGLFSLNTDAGEKGAYRDLFYSAELLQNEVLLGTPTGIDIYGSQNNYFNASGADRSLVRPFINTYLCKDGTPFTDKSNFETMSFVEEFKDRDERLAQTVRGPEYKMITTVGGDTPETVAPDIPNAASLLGYQVIKFTLDKTLNEHEAAANMNTNSTPVYRYAEVLLNYAEAKAELNEITDADWSKTIGALRRRAGITGGDLDKLPTKVDQYLKTTFYPNVTSAIILEIRRERACELCLEGLRVLDWKRWANGERISDLPWTGIHIANLGAVDINGDGTVDAYFSTDAKDPQSEYANVWVKVFTSGTDEGLHATENVEGGGYDLEYIMPKVKRNWEADGRQYLAPIPEQSIVRYKNNGYTLTQNPNW